MPTWATPAWKGDWDGDPESVLGALEAVQRVLLDEGLAIRMAISIKWEDGEAEEDSIEDAREVLLFARRPSDMNAVCLFAPHADSEVSHVGINANEYRLRVSTKARDFTLAHRLVETAKNALEPEAQEGESVPLTSDADRLDSISEARPSLLTWLESHQGLIAVISILVAIALAVIFAA